MTRWIYCPQCKLELDQSGKYPKCPSGHFIKYPNPVASAFVFISFHSKYLFLRRNYEPKFGSWNVPGGFVEYGESAEQALAREVKEETQLTIDISKLKYLGSFYQEYGDKNGTKNLGIAFCLELETRPEIVLNQEHSEYIWRTLEESPEIESTDISNALEFLKKINDINN